MKKDILNLISDIDSLNANLNDIEFKLKINRLNVEEKLIILYQDYFKSIIRKSGYDLKVEEYINMRNEKDNSLVIRGANIFTFEDTLFKNGTPCFQIYLFLNKKAEKSFARILIKLSSQRYWEYEMYERKDFEINLENMESLELVILNEINSLIQTNNQRLFHEQYMNWGLAKYRSLEEGFELYKKQIIK